MFISFKILLLYVQPVVQRLGAVQASCIVTSSYFIIPGDLGEAPYEAKSQNSPQLPCIFRFSINRNNRVEITSSDCSNNCIHELPRGDIQTDCKYQDQIFAPNSCINQNSCTNSASLPWKTNWILSIKNRNMNRYDWFPYKGKSVKLLSPWRWVKIQFKVHWNTKIIWKRLRILLCYSIYQLFSTLNITTKQQ